MKLSCGSHFNILIFNNFVANIITFLLDCSNPVAYNRFVVKDIPKRPLF